MNCRRVGVHRRLRLVQFVLLVGVRDRSVNCLGQCFLHCFLEDGSDCSPRGAAVARKQIMEGSCCSMACFGTVSRVIRNVWEPLRLGVVPRAILFTMQCSTLFYKRSLAVLYRSFGALWYAVPLVQVACGI